MEAVCSLVMTWPDETGQRPPSAIDEWLDAARSTLVRVTVDCLAAEVADGALVVDIRPVEQRRRDGELVGAVVLDRTVLEWRLDPTCAWRIPQAADPDRRVILVCDEGYSSSLAAATLQRLGLRHATDLVGGFQALLTSRGPMPRAESPETPAATEFSPTRWAKPGYDVVAVDGYLDPVADRVEAGGQPGDVPVPGAGR
jgi:rhodanese-related sulfurtransferase